MMIEAAFMELSMCNCTMGKGSCQYVLTLSLVHNTSHALQEVSIWNHQFEQFEKESILITTEE